MRRLVVTYPLLHFFDLIFDVAIGDQNVGPAVVVIIKKETAEAERDQGCTANFRAGSFVNKKSVAFVVIQREHLVGKIADNQAGASGMIVVPGVNAHSGARNSVFAKSYARGNRLFFKSPIVLVEV